MPKQPKERAKCKMSIRPGTSLTARGQGRKNVPQIMETPNYI